MKTKISAAILVLFAFCGAFYMGKATAKNAAIVCELKRSERDGVTVEVWRNGELSDEWEPRDGRMFRVLDRTLRDDWQPEDLAD